MTAKPKRPEGLGPQGARLWRQVTSELELDPGDDVLLGQACRCIDEIVAMETALEDTGLWTEGAAGQKRLNPLYAALSNHRGRLGRLLQQVLPDSQQEPASRSRLQPGQTALGETTGPRWRIDDHPTPTSTSSTNESRSSRPDTTPTSSPNSPTGTRPWLYASPPTTPTTASTRTICRPDRGPARYGTAPTTSKAPCLTPTPAPRHTAGQASKDTGATAAHSTSTTSSETADQVVSGFSGRSQHGETPRHPRCLAAATPGDCDPHSSNSAVAASMPPSLRRGGGVWGVSADASGQGP